MIPFLIIIVVTIVVILCGYGFYLLGLKRKKKLIAKRALKEAAEAENKKKIEEIRRELLSKNRIVLVEDIQAELNQKENKFAKWIRTFWKEFCYIQGKIFHYIGYIFWPLKWLKSKTYDKLRYDQQKVTISLIFLLPTIIGFLLFFVYPLVMSLIYSFSTLELVQGGPIIHFGKAFTMEAINNKDYSVTDPNVSTIFFNYIYAFRENADFPVALWETISTTFIDTVVITIFSLLIAVMLNSDFKGRGLVRAIFFLPVIFNSEAISNALESADSLNTILSASGTGALSALFNMEQFLIGLKIPRALVTFLGGITSTIYRTISYSGIQILIFLAAIQSVPKHLYEAAKIEGATKYESFWKITLPMVSPMILTIVVYTVVDSFLRSNINDIIDLQYEGSAYGRHAAMSWIYFISSILMLALMLGILSKWIFYYDEKK